MTFFNNVVVAICCTGFGIGKETYWVLDLQDGSGIGWGENVCTATRSCS